MRTISTLALLLSLNLFSSAAVADDNTSSTTADGRARAIRGGYVGLGPAAMTNLNADSLGYAFALGYAYSADSAVLRLGANLAFQSGAIFSSAGVGGNYFFTEGATAPFVGANLGMGLVRVPGATAADSSSLHGGFVVTPEVGVHFMRNADVNLELAATASFLLKNVTTGMPYLLGLRLGIYI